MIRKQPVNFPENALQTINAYSVLAGFLLSFILFFIRPVFLNPEHTMEFFLYVPAAGEIGLDLNQMLSYCESYFIKHGTPYIGNNLYPPLATVIFGPFLLLDKSTAYTVITIINVSAFVLTALIIPILIINNKNHRSIIQLMFLTGLFSYGFQFELERGQFNLIAFSLAMSAIYLFHSKPRYRLLSYILLTLSIQLKVFSLIFLIILVDDWTDWRNNIKRFTGMIFINISLLFILGYQIFLDFIGAISKQALNPHITITNHSIEVFVELLSRKIGYRNIFLAAGMDLNQIKAMAGYSNVLQLLLQICVLACLLFVLIRAIRMNSNGLNPYLLSICTLLALLLPAVSNDYKLPLITGPLAIVLQENIIIGKNNRPALVPIILGFVGSIAYSATLFSYTNKPLILNNNFPSLLLILLVVTIMSTIADKNLFLKQEPAI
jgi:hypothetical protein